MASLEFSTRKSVALALLALVGALFIPSPSAAQGQVAEADAPAEAKPTFKSKRGEENFDKAVEEFEAKKYSDAAKTFKRARTGAKRMADKKAIDTWIAASQGGIGLSILARKPKSKETLFAAMDGMERYRGTKIEGGYKALVASLSEAILTIVEDFDVPKAAYSKKYGKKHVKADPAKPALVVHGGGCIEWAQTPQRNATQLRIKGASVPKSWQKYEGLLFWIDVEKRVDLQVIALTPGKAKGQINSHVAIPKIKSAAGWQRVFVPMKTMRKYGQGSLANVEACVFQVASRNDFKLRVDRVCLVKKAGA